MRFYSAATTTDVELRVLRICQCFVPITVEKVSLDLHLINDLGLVDPVDVISAIEYEFGLEISDEQAEKLLTPAKIAQYVCMLHEHSCPGRSYDSVSSV